MPVPSAGIPWGLCLNAGKERGGKMLVENESEVWLGEQLCPPGTRWGCAACSRGAGAEQCPAVLASLH